jgi:hypothetical protein
MWLSWSRQKKNKRILERRKKSFFISLEFKSQILCGNEWNNQKFSFWAEGGASKMFMKKVVITDEYFHAH